MDSPAVVLSKTTLALTDESEEDRNRGEEIEMPNIYVGISNRWKIRSGGTVQRNIRINFNTKNTSKVYLTVKLIKQ